MNGPYAHGFGSPNKYCIIRMVVGAQTADLVYIHIQ